LVRWTLAVLLGCLATPVAAQDDLDLSEIFTNRGFYEESGILAGVGDVEFVASLWLLPGPADSTRALIGVSLSNSDLEFKRVDGGPWRASYTVVAELEPEDGEKIERRWDSSVDIASYDEALLTGETIVFQGEIALTAGDYHLDLMVVDQNAAESGRAETDVKAPVPSAVEVGEPVALQTAPQEMGDGEYVVLPSHSFPSPPERIEFMAVAQAPSTSGPLVARARLLEKEGDEDGREIASWSGTLSPTTRGPLVAFGAVDSDDSYGQYDLEITLVDASGRELGRARTPLLIAGSASWVAEHWKDALSLIQYEATGREMEILEDIEDPSQRMEAWACFWRMRDPIKATVVNEAMQDYFGRIQTANESWKSALRAGYLSDRGRVFVTLGPPDDIVSDPFPSGNVPVEVWTYFSSGRQFQVVFVDRIGFNNYQLDNLNTYQREVSALMRRKRGFLRERAQLCPLLQPAIEEDEE
jgi:GWxTD domain-containing protein